MRKRAVLVVKGTPDDMIHAASLERIPAELNTRLACGCSELLQKSLERNADGETQRNLWAIARLGARQPLYSSAGRPAGRHRRLAGTAAATRLETRPTLPPAVAHLARMTGDHQPAISTTNCAIRYWTA